jgi:hypothetical protein
MVRALLPLLFLLLLLALAGITLVAVRQLSRARAQRPLELEAARIDGIVTAVNDRAWADRDVSPALAGALIEEIRRARASGVPKDPAIIDALREVAWVYRDSDPELAVVVLDLLRKGS